MKLKWYGTATILLEYDGVSLLFDPFFPLNNESGTAKPNVETFSSVAGIFVTHGHLDHITGIPVIMKQSNEKTTVYCTAAPRNTLISKGVEKERTREIKPGDTLNIKPFEVRVLKGKHIVFDAGIIIKRLFSLRNLTHRKNLLYLLKENKICVEAGETVVYDISVAEKRILLMGSLNLDDDTDYPQGADLLILPFQGRLNMSEYAMPFIERLQPKSILLDHFDDTFPPISSTVQTEPFISLMKKNYPNIPVARLHLGV